MFLKSRSAPSSKRGSRSGAADAVSLSIIAADVRIRGDVTAEGELHLDGAIDGDVRCHGIIQGETGRIAGSLTADSVVLRGRVEGSITARTVTLERTAQVLGDITHESISIEAGAHVDGRFTPRPQPAAALTTAGTTTGGADVAPATALRAIASN